MSKSKIPKPTLKCEPSRIPVTKKVNELPKIVFSFEILEETEYFSLDGTCNNWPAELFEMMQNISKLTRTELPHVRKYRVHTHETANPPSPLPEGIELKDCYQMRISKSKGGIHGIFSGNVFYVLINLQFFQKRSG